MNEQLKNEFMQLEHEAIQSEKIQEQETAEILKPQSPGDALETKELLMPIIGLCCDVLAPNWQIKEPEKVALSESYAAIIDKYFPDSLSKLGVELNALLITAAIIGPKLSIPRIIELQPENEGEAN